MSIEIKTMDIANEAEELCINLYQSFGWKLKSSQRVFNQTSRPVGTISAGNVAYVHSETETVDFTKLVFERETTMENYGKLCQLEREYFNLVDALPDNPPAYSSDIPIEEWAKQSRPHVAGVMGPLVTALFMAAAGIVAICIVSVMNGDTPIDALYDEIKATWHMLLGMGALCGVISYILSSKVVFNPIALRRAIRNKHSNERTRLESQYKYMREAALEYERKFARMDEILEEARALNE